MAKKARPLRAAREVSLAKNGTAMNEGESMRWDVLVEAVDQGVSIAFQNKATMKSRKLALLARMIETATTVNTEVNLYWSGASAVNGFHPHW